MPGMAVAQFKITKLAPVLEAKVANVDVAGALSGTRMIDNLDGTVIILVNRSRAGLWVA